MKNEATALSVFHASVSFEKEKRNRARKGGHSLVVSKVLLVVAEAILRRVGGGDIELSLVSRRFRDSSPLAIIERDAFQGRIEYPNHPSS